MQKENKIVALFDMDLIAYRSAAVTEKRTVEVTHKKTNKKKTFKTRTEFKNYLKDLDIEYKQEDYEIKDVQTPDPLSYTIKVINSQVEKISKAINATKKELYIGVSANNFRTKLPLPVPYKGQREAMLRPLNLSKAKQYCVDTLGALMIEDYEVDDHLTVRYHQLKSEGYEPVIISLDKDTRGCIGVKYYDYTSNFPEIKEIPVISYIDYDKNKKKVLGEGLHFYAYQMLAGDPTDFYSPYDLHKKKGFGDISIVEYLKTCKSADEIFTCIEEKYKEWFGSEFEYKTFDGKQVKKTYKEILDIYHSCVYMHRKTNDTTGFYDLWEEMKKYDPV